MKLEGPLMSLGAHGTIAKAVTYSMRGGNARAAIYRPPRDARTQAQLNQRAHYLDGTRLWKLMTDADRLAWTQTHQLPNASGYNTFVQTIMNRITRRRDWLHPDFFSQDVALQNFIMVQLMEPYAGTTFLDISGNARDWAPTDATQVQGNRGQAALLTATTGNQQVQNGANLPDMAALTIALRFYTDTPQGSLGGTIRAIGAYNHATDRGFILSIHTTGFRLLIGEAGDEYATTITGTYTPNMWNNLVATFNAADSGRIRVILNGAEIINELSNMAQASHTAEALLIGGTVAGTKWPGRFDNVTLYNGVTSALQI